MIACCSFCAGADAAALRLRACLLRDLVEPLAPALVLALEVDLAVALELFDLETAARVFVVAIELLLMLLDLALDFLDTPSA